MKLGHLSNKILQNLTSQHFDISFHSIVACDACAFAKQKCLKYSSSNNKSTFCFKLIHTSFWGLFLFLPLMDTSIL